MDLALTRRGDYAVRAALCLANWGGDGRYVKIREVAQAMALPASYTPRCCGCWPTPGWPRPGRAVTAATG
jgi:hypothetical protein